MRASPSHAARRLLAVLGAAALAACASRVPSPGGAAAGGQRLAVPPFVQAVRARLRAHDRAGALALLEPDRPLEAGAPERAWLLTVLRSTGCSDRRARRDAAALPASDLGDALRAWTAEDPARALARLAARPRRGPDRWSTLAAARLRARLGDAEGALAYAAHAAGSRRDFVRHEAHLLQTQALLGAGELDAAREAAHAALATDPLDARARRLLAAVHERDGFLDDAVLERLETVRMAPASEGYALALGAQLDRGASPRLWGAVHRGLPAQPPGGRVNAQLLAVRGRAAAAVGRVDEGIALMRRALEHGALAVPLDRHLRQRLVERGRYREAGALLLAAIPPGVADDPRNRLRDRWQALRAALAGAPDRCTPPAARRALAEAFVGVGALVEASHVLATLEGSPDRTLRARVDGHLAFQAALREDVEAGYRATLRGEDPPTFEAALGRMRALAWRHLHPVDRHAFADPGRGARSVPFLGRWLDHRTDTASPVVRHFRRFGRFLLFGQQREGPPEAIVLSLASLTAAQPIRSAGRTHRHDVAIGYDRTSRAYVGAQGRLLGGACLADGLWLDADAARETELSLRRALTLDPAYVRAVRASGPLPADTLDGPYALTDPGCTAARLLLRYLERNPDDAWGSFRTLRAHEFGHVADIRRHLPVLPKLPNTISLFAGQGFSSHGVEMELERRAQLGAVIEAPDPDLALAEMVVALPVWEREPEVHDGGYARALRQMVIHIANHPARYPSIDPRLRIVTQLDRLDNEQIRALARAVRCR